MAEVLYNTVPFDGLFKGKVTFLLGENGAGKSRELGRLASDFESRGVTTIAISNTAFDRFPVKRSLHYARLTPAMGKGYVKSALRQALFNGDDERRDARQVARTFQYAGFDEVIGVAPRLRKFDVREAMDTVIRDEKISSQDARLIAMALESFLVPDGDSGAGPYWRDLSGGYSDYDSRGLAAVVRNEVSLKRLRIIREVDFFLRKKEEIFPLYHASSGELTLIAMYAFLATRMKQGAAILIDEPENSLHPRWQSEYCSRLFDLFHLYEPRIFLASHSPIVVSGADSGGIRTKIVNLNPVSSSSGAAIVSEGIDKSIDGILLEAFGVLSPASHYLSELVAEMLSDLSTRKRSLSSVLFEIDQLRDRSYDRRQIEFLAGAKDLAAAVDREADQIGGGRES